MDSIVATKNKSIPLIKSNVLLALFSGMVFSLALAPFDQWYLAYIALVPLLYVVYTSSLPQAVFCSAVAMFVIATAWWYPATLYSVPVYLQICGILMLSAATWVLLSKSWLHRFGPGWAAPLVMAAMWAGLEQIHTSFAVGVPGNLGISQYSIPQMMLFASVLGIFGVSFIIVLVNSLFAWCIYRYQYCDLSGSLKVLAVAVLVVTANYLGGAASMNKQHEQTISAVVIQPVISSELYRNRQRNVEDREYIANTIDRLFKQTLKKQPDIIFWPEGGDGTIAMRLHDRKQQYLALAKNHGVDLILSFDDINEHGNTFNSVFSISSDGRYLGKYDKLHLVPGAEDRYTPGSEYRLLPTSHGELGAAICYESGFPDLFRHAADDGAEVLLSTTSDAVFKRSAMPLSHAALAVFRAVENNRWLVHASNTGPSMIVSSTGVITAQSALYERGLLSGRLSTVQQTSVYTRWGYLVPRILALAVALAVILALVVCVLRYFLQAPGLHFRDALMQAGGKWPGQLRRLALVCLQVIPVVFIVALIITLSSLVVVNHQIDDGTDAISSVKDFIAPFKKHEDTITAAFLQQSKTSCGPAALSYLFYYYGMNVSEGTIARDMHIGSRGTTLEQLATVARNHHFIAKGFNANLAWLKQQSLPLIAHYTDIHYVVVNDIDDDSVLVFDPLVGHVKLSLQAFSNQWSGYVMTVSPSVLEP